MVRILNRIGRALSPSRFGYDALNPKGRRKSTGATVYREDKHARGSKHRQLQETAAELARNLSLAAWMVRRHLDYVSQFEFYGRNDSDELNEQLAVLMAEDSRPARADVAGRFSREKLFRLAEMRRVLDGDTLLLKLNDGRLQGIQADLIRDPTEQNEAEQWINGVLITRVGRPLSYGIYERKDYTGVKYVRRVNSINAIHYGFFERYAADQIRGISPLVSALNPLRDVYENFNYALAKAKVSQLFALAFFRDADDSAGDVDEDFTLGRDDDDGDHVNEPQGYRVDFGSGPVQLDLEPGDRAEFLESKQPSGEFQNFTRLVIQVALKALDIPYSFYDESHTNFFGSRAAWLHYERSAHDKRDDQREMRRNYTVWKLREWIRDGRLVLPAGMFLSDVRFEWVPRGMPWWNPAQEIKGHVAAIEAGLDSPQRICRATGTDYYDNVDAIQRAIDYARNAGVVVSFDPNPEQATADGDSATAIGGGEMSSVEAVQKVYLGVDTVVTRDEARDLVNDVSGSQLSTPTSDSEFGDDANEGGTDVN